MKNSFGPPTHTLEHVLGSDPAIIRGYAQGVQKALQKGPLNLLDRDRLIARGERLGIKRFDANLIVAAMEHQTRAGPRMTLYKEDSIDIAFKTPKWLTWGVAIGLQSIIATFAYWLMYA